MLRFSGGYIPINPNFVVGFKENTNKNLNQDFIGFVQIVKNMLLRGTPIKPNNELQHFLGYIDKYSNYKYYNDESQILTWDNIIKGGANTNPAVDFFNYLRQLFPKESSSFIPECPLRDILPEDTDVSLENAVDFYSPLYKVVIEIDGLQHQEQVIEDRIRDRKLYNAGIIVIRIPTAKITNNNIQYEIGRLERIFKSNITKNIDIINNLSDIERKYLYYFRFQIALLTSIEQGFIDLSKQIINISLIDPDKTVPVEVFMFAIEEIKTLLLNLFVLANKDFSFPEIKIILNSSEKSDVCFDIKIDTVYDQQIFLLKDKFLSIRNDYFFFPMKNKDFDNSRYKNHFIVSVSDLRFPRLDPNDSQIVAALTFFLRYLFGHDGRITEFRPNQVEIICKGLNPDNAVIGILPTGSGKSVCYQLMALLTPGITLVITPLKALMEDQCENLYKRHNISVTTYIDSSDIGKKNIFDFKNNHSLYVYVSPERFFNPKFQEILEQYSNQIGQIAVDEVHCLSEWGHDFRTSYLLLFNVLQHIGTNKTLLIGTTATASLEVVNDISKEFKKMRKYPEVITSKDVRRTNLHFGLYEVKTDEDRINTIKQHVEENINDNKKTVVFVPYKKQTLSLTNALNNDIQSDELFVQSFSAETPDKEKKQIISDLKRGKTKAIVATKAFGMGLDIPDIRHTIHYCIGGSVESIWQEMGRAGRDGKDSYCDICFYNNDYDKNMFESKNIPDLDRLKSSNELKERFFLIKLSNYTPERETDICFNVYRKLKSLNEDVALKDMIKSCPGINQTSFEKALYKLYLLKLIDLWTINYSQGIDNPVYSNLGIKDRTNKEIYDALMKYATTYNPSFSDFDVVDINLAPEIYLREAIKNLCVFSQKTFFEHRWQSLGTLYKLLCSVQEEKDPKLASDIFSNGVNAYFKTNVALEDLIAQEREERSYNNYNKWLDVLKTTDLPLEQFQYQILHYVESPSNFLCVNFISGVLMLQLDNFEHVNGINRLKYVYDYIYKSANGIEIITELSVDILKYLKFDRQKIIYLQFLTDNYLEVIESKLLQKEFGKVKGADIIKERIDLYNLMNLVKDFKNQMEEINEQ